MNESDIDEDAAIEKELLKSKLVQLLQNSKRKENVSKIQSRIHGSMHDGFLYVSLMNGRQFTF